MAGRSYGGRREEWRARGGSIFTDDADRRDRGPAGREEERGFFDRAGDEVRSWFGDEEAERRRERDIRRDDARSAFESGGEGGAWRSRTPYGGYGADEYRGAADYGRGPGGYGRRDHGGRSGFLEQSQWDEDYRRWRDQEIARFDREYEDYRRDRQQQFDRDFDSWRTSRLTEGGTLGTGRTGERPAMAGAVGAGAGSASATRASTSSGPRPDTNAPSGSEAGSAPRGRGGRSRG